MSQKDIFLFSSGNYIEALGTDDGYRFNCYVYVMQDRYASQHRRFWTM